MSTSVESGKLPSSGSSSLTAVVESWQQHLEQLTSSCRVLRDALGEDFLRGEDPVQNQSSINSSNAAAVDQRVAHQVDEAFDWITKITGQHGFPPLSYGPDGLTHKGLLQGYPTRPLIKVVCWALAAWSATGKFPYPHVESLRPNLLAESSNYQEAKQQLQAITSQLSILLSTSPLIGTTSSAAARVAAAQKAASAALKSASLPAAPHIPSIPEGPDPSPLGQSGSEPDVSPQFTWASAAAAVLAASGSAGAAEEVPGVSVCSSGPCQTTQGGMGTSSPSLSSHPQTPGAVAAGAVAPGAVAAVAVAAEAAAPAVPEICSSPFGSASFALQVSRLEVTAAAASTQQQPPQQQQEKEAGQAAASPTSAAVVSPPGLPPLVLPPSKQDIKTVDSTDVPTPSVTAPMVATSHAPQPSVLLDPSETLISHMPQLALGPFAAAAAAAVAGECSGEQGRDDAKARPSVVDSLVGPFGSAVSLSDSPMGVEVRAGSRVSSAAGDGPPVARIWSAASAGRQDSIAAAGPPSPFYAAAAAAAAGLSPFGDSAVPAAAAEPDEQAEPSGTSTTTTSTAAAAAAAAEVPETAAAAAAPSGPSVVSAFAQAAILMSDMLPDYDSSSTGGGADAKTRSKSNSNSSASATATTPPLSAFAVSEMPISKFASSFLAASQHSAGADAAGACRADSGSAGLEAVRSHDALRSAPEAGVGPVGGSGLPPMCSSGSSSSTTSKASSETIENLLLRVYKDPHMLYVLLGFRITTGTSTCLDRIPSLRECVTAFAQLHAPSTKSRLTVGARALAKHTHRDSSSSWWEPATGPECLKNALAVRVLAKVLSGACWINLHHLPPDKSVLEMRVVQGYGARWEVQVQQQDELEQQQRQQQQAGSEAQQPQSGEEQGQEKQGGEEHVPAAQPQAGHEAAAEAVAEGAESAGAHVTPAPSPTSEHPGVVSQGRAGNALVVRFRGFLEPQIVGGHEVGWRHAGGTIA
eukprot:CAMPEP_0202896898 /NCGR_PEP_ID=MMETSP1392-20130828/5802_1 /ASSEMBLY_ACC=CAM_ASM_000868 /TAXON_ID=225041 /ORGANISM="Chlamydomonas chlamydogama, Strain SAG 11-48b" /LENGTH=978 /DNA_ID=CAMNT_0049582401 /DNA_START=108 /DNA_END=3044 /DNA_ORIENTATION=+